MVGGRETGQEAEGEVGLVAEPDDRVDQPVAFDDDRDLVPRQQDVGEPGADPIRQLRRPQRILPVVRTCSCSFRIPNISISGLGGQPGTYTSTGTIVSTPWTIA